MMRAGISDRVGSSVWGVARCPRRSCHRNSERVTGRFEKSSWVGGESGPIGSGGVPLRGPNVGRCRPEECGTPRVSRPKEAASTPAKPSALSACRKVGCSRAIAREWRPLLRWRSWLCQAPPSRSPDRRRSIQPRLMDDGVNDGADDGSLS